MGFMDELKKLTRPYSEDETAFDEFEETPKEKPARHSSFDRDLEAQPMPREERHRPAGAGAKVVNINATAQMQVILAKPDRFDMVTEIADHLRNKHAVVLNLEATNKEVSRRLVDFLCGCAYALDGKIKKIAVSTFLITPYNVDIVGDVIDELENNGVYL